MISVILCLLCRISPALANEPPIANPGMSVYAGPDPVYLDGSASDNLDESAPLQYMWRQVSGPELSIGDPTVAFPQVTGPPRFSSRGVPIATVIPQTDEVQVCVFELTVSDGTLESLPANVKVVIVPDYGSISTLEQENPPFDPNKPTLVYFGGGNGTSGGGPWDRWQVFDWYDRANIVSFPFYGPDTGDGLRTYYHCGDMLMVYLSSVAWDYHQPIQTMGFSTGGQPAIDVGIRSNLTYRDRRYAVNRVTFLDGTFCCRSVYSESISTYLSSSVDDEQCWIDNYVGTLLGVHSDDVYDGFYSGVLGVGYALSYDLSLPNIDLHRLINQWYANSLINSDMSRFNGGVVGGAYWSVVGLGKNLQLASTPDDETYKFYWVGDGPAGTMDFHDEASHPGRLPEPVTLVEPVNTGDPNGVVFTCKPSENAVGYELLFGPDPYRVMDYFVVSDTPAPPIETVKSIPFPETWWTIRVRDAFGSTLYADPIPVSLEDMPIVRIEDIK